MDRVETNYKINKTSYPKLQKPKKDNLEKLEKFLGFLKKVFLKDIKESPKALVKTTRAASNSCSLKTEQAMKDILRFCVQTEEELVPLQEEVEMWALKMKQNLNSKDLISVQRTAFKNPKGQTVVEFKASVDGRMLKGLFLRGPKHSIPLGFSVETVSQHSFSSESTK